MELSFVKNQGGFMSVGGGVRASANFNDLNASSIDRASEDAGDRFADINIIAHENERILQ